MLPPKAPSETQPAHEGSTRPAPPATTSSTSAIQVMRLNCRWPCPEAREAKACASGRWSSILVAGALPVGTILESYSRQIALRLSCLTVNVGEKVSTAARFAFPLLSRVWELRDNLTRLRRRLCRFGGVFACLAADRRRRN